MASNFVDIIPHDILGMIATLLYHPAAIENLRATSRELRKQVTPIEQHINEL